MDILFPTAETLSYCYMFKLSGSSFITEIMFFKTGGTICGMLF